MYTAHYGGSWWRNCCHGNTVVHAIPLSPTLTATRTCPHLMANVDMGMIVPSALFHAHMRACCEMHLYISLPSVCC